MKKRPLITSLFCLCVFVACLDKNDTVSNYKSQENTLSDSLNVVKAGQLIQSGQYDEAKVYLQQAAKSKNIRVKAAYYFQMTILEEKLENLEGAYANFVEYHNYTEEIFKEEQQLFLKQEDRKTLLNYLFISLGVLAFVVCSVIFYLFHKKKAKEQKEFQSLLNQYKDGEIELNQLDKLIESKKSYSTQLTFQAYLIQTELFKETSIYTEMQTLGKQTKSKDAKVFNYQKQEQLQIELQKYFSTFISDLKTYSSKLTEKDTLLCCLSLLPINTFTKALCLGSTDTNIVKQRKFQIRKKMPKDSFCQLFFEFIFEKRSD